MEYLIPLLIILFILLVFVTLLGHGIWVALAWFFRVIRPAKKNRHRTYSGPLISLTLFSGSAYSFACRNSNQ